MTLGIIIILWKSVFDVLWVRGDGLGCLLNHRHIKPKNPVQKCLHIIESCACILTMFILMFLYCDAEDKERLLDALISFGICSTPKLSKQVTLLWLTCKATQWVRVSE